MLLSPSWFQVDDPEAALKELETHLGFPLRGFVPYTRSVRPGMEIPKDRLQKYLEDVLCAHPTGTAGGLALPSENMDIGFFHMTYGLKNNIKERLLISKRTAQPFQFQ